jgi:hypothetical protein
MNALRLTELLIYTLGAFAYGAMLALWVRELGRLGWGGRETPGGVSSSEIATLNGLLLTVSFLWFVGNAAILLVGLTPIGRMWQLDVAVILMAFVFPPLIMHLTWSENLTAHTRLAPGWRLALWPAYAGSLAVPAWCLTVFFGADKGMNRVANQLLGTGLTTAFITAAVYCIALVARHGAAGRRHGRNYRGHLVRLFALMIVVFLALFVVTSSTTVGRPMATAGTIVEVIAKSLPLVFMFVSTYYENRFTFFDLFVKRGLALLMTIAALTMWFALTLPVLAPLASTWAGPWIFAIAVVPVVAAIPWLYNRVSALLDRRWLGRRFSTVDALTRFLSALRSATTEAQLTHQAEDGLSDIFGAPAAVRLDGSPGGVPFQVRHETPVPFDGPEGGRFLMGNRTSDAPYFSQDVALLASLAQVFASVCDNLRLQERKREQEQRTRELSLDASRSELKALRAQINPHFLFNALNSIAGLIHREPAVADRAIEQLAEVFRYALRGAESEWALLDDEMDFVRAYLDVEQARFGDRLRTEVTIEDAARGARIPTMIVQTLVENAVKHGVASVRGPATVNVSARYESGRLVVAVTDNGAGFRDTESTALPRMHGGYGLANVRQRLAGYFGAAAALGIDRDGVQGLTTVSVSLPLIRQEPRSQPEAEAVQ